MFEHHSLYIHLTFLLTIAYLVDAACMQICMGLAYGLLSLSCRGYDHLQQSLSCRRANGADAMGVLMLDADAQSVNQLGPGLL